MKKELENTRQILGELYKTLLVKKYMDYHERGEVVPAEELEDVEIYNDIIEAYVKGKEAELKELQTKKKAEYIELLSNSFKQIAPFTGKEFIDECMKDVFAGQIKQAQDKLKEMEDKVKIKRVRDEYECQDYTSVCEYKKAKQQKPIRTRILGVKVEVLEQTPKNKEKKIFDLEKINIEVPFKNDGEVKENLVKEDKGLSR